MTDVSEVLTASIIRAMSSTRRNIPEDSHLHTRRCENLKYHKFNVDQICPYFIVNLSFSCLQLLDGAIINVINGPIIIEKW
jgi:hypothetical protein